MNFFQVKTFIRRLIKDFLFGRFFIASGENGIVIFFYLK